MKTVDWAFMSFFVANMAAIIGGLYLLIKIQGTAEMTKIDLMKSIGYNTDAVGTLKAAAKIFTDDSENPSEKASVRAIAGLTKKIDDLTEIISKNQQVQPNTAGDPEIAQKLREKLKEVLIKNAQIQTDLDQVKQRLKKATAANNDVKDGFSAVKGVDPEFVKMMVSRTTALEYDLRHATDRAESAENLASSQTSQLEDLRERAEKNDFVRAAAESIAVKTIRDEKDALEKSLKAEKEVMQSTLIGRIQHLETELEQAITEKNFIEERYIALLSGDEKS